MCPFLILSLYWYSLICSLYLSLCNSAGVAERSYPTFEVKGGGQEELPHV